MCVCVVFWVLLKPFSVDVGFFDASLVPMTYVHVVRMYMYAFTFYRSTVRGVVGYSYRKLEDQYLNNYETQTFVIKRNPLRSLHES